LAPIAGTVAAVLASGTSFLIVALVSDPELTKGDIGKNFEQWSVAHATSFVAIFATLVPTQIAFFGTACFFAAFDRRRWWARLGFVRWKVPFSTIMLAVVGTLGVHFAIGVIAERLIHEPSESIKMIGRMFTEPQGLAAIGVGLLMSVLPGLCEEALFRGYTQSGLLRRLDPVAAIGVTSILFSIAHFDLQHSLAVLPLGAWLGFVAWKTGSVWPAVLCHFVNNGVSFVVLRLTADSERPGSPTSPLYYVVGVLLLVAAVLAARRLIRERPDADGPTSRSPSSLEFPLA